MLEFNKRGCGVLKIFSAKPIGRDIVGYIIDNLSRSTILHGTSTAPLDVIISVVLPLALH